MRSAPCMKRGLCCWTVASGSCSPAALMGPGTNCIDDFATTSVAQNFELTWGHVQGFPGIRDPTVKDWFKAHAVKASEFVSAYPEPTVKQVWRALAVAATFDQVLDNPDAAEALQEAGPQAAAGSGRLNLRPSRRRGVMTEEQSAVLELDDIQGPVLRTRPLPYFGAYLLLRIDKPTHGREMLGRLAPRVATAANWHNPPIRSGSP